MATSIPEELSIEHEERASKGRYVLRLDGAEAEMTYSSAGESMGIIDHTEVPSATRGRSVGQALMQRAIKDARRRPLDHTAVPGTRSTPR